MTKNANFPVFTQLDTTRNQGVGGDEGALSQGGRTATPSNGSTGFNTTIATVNGIVSFTVVELL